jgi:hypothetical protein
MKDLIRVDAHVGQRIVLFLGHRENEPMGDYGTFGSRRKFRQTLSPDFGDTLELCALEWPEIDIQARTIEVKGGRLTSVSAAS